MQREILEVWGLQERLFVRGLEEAEERVAVLGVGGCGGGRGDRGVEAGCEDSEGVWDELVGEGA